MRPCAAWDCPNKVSEAMKSAFCFNCLAALALDKQAMLADLDKVLRLEAEFTAYCREHGLPDPHA